MERRTIRYARRKVAGRLLEPNRAQSLWRNRMGRLYLAAPHGRTELILGVAETVPAPKGMAWGLYSDEDSPFETWLVDRDGAHRLAVAPASLIDAYGPWRRLTSSPRLKPGDSLHKPDSEGTSDLRERG